MVTELGSEMDTLAQTAPNVPAWTEDFYGDAFIADPFPRYKKMRSLGPILWLPQYGNYAVTRYAEVRQALRMHEIFSSASGIAADSFGCEFAKGGLITSDPPLHTWRRRIVGAPLMPTAVEAIRGQIEVAAEKLAEDLVARGSFDGIRDLAQFLPLALVRDMVGLPEYGSDKMLDWASATFDLLGVQNERGKRAVEATRERRQFEKDMDLISAKPGSWTAQIYERAARGEFPEAECPNLARSYIGPSLDTTIAATGHLFYQLATNPAQWSLLREDPSLVSAAVDEAVRIGSPVRSFTRQVTEDIEFSDVRLPAGARVMLIYGSANRDERQFPDPDTFDVTRTDRAHIGFGHGIHTCVGMHLAKMEMEAVLRALIKRVERLDVGEPTIVMNNSICGYATLPLSIQASRSAPAPHAGENDPQVQDWLTARVSGRVEVGHQAIMLELVSTTGAPLPRFNAGAHVDVKLEPALIRQYSICSDPQQLQAYRIGVLLDPLSRGGSEYIHKELTVGSVVEISLPRETFLLEEPSSQVTLIAAGIGITPLLSMAYELDRQGRDFSLHYRTKSISAAAFAGEIENASFRDRVKFYPSDTIPRDRLDLQEILAGGSQDQIVYCCGPAGFIEAVKSAARAVGLSAHQVKFERFSVETRPDDQAFDVVAHRSNRRIHVEKDETILGALARCGISAPSSCETGVCGTCLTKVLSGTVDHRDAVQTSKERASGEKIAICCSRAVGSELILDI